MFFFKKILKKIDRCISVKTNQMSSKLDPVTFQVHFPATLTTDGTQRMKSPKNDPKNVKKISVFIKKMNETTHFFWKNTF